jgi:hypothetical protein
MNLDSMRSAADLSPADRAVVDALPAGYETDATVGWLSCSVTWRPHKRFSM